MTSNAHHSTKTCPITPSASSTSAYDRLTTFPTRSLGTDVWLDAETIDALMRKGYADGAVDAKNAAQPREFTLRGTREEGIEGTYICGGERACELSGAGILDDLGRIPVTLLVRRARTTWKEIYYRRRVTNRQFTNEFQVRPD